jgi:hypothetical protein
MNQPSRAPSHNDVRGETCRGMGGGGGSNGGGPGGGGS